MRSFILMALYLGTTARNYAQDVDQAWYPFIQNFTAQFAGFEGFETYYDYREFLAAIPDSLTTSRQLPELNSLKHSLDNFGDMQDQPALKLQRDHLDYQLQLMIQLAELEDAWQAGSKVIPSGGLHSLNQGRDWYQYRIAAFTGSTMTPEEVMAFGRSEVNRVKDTLIALQLANGFSDLSSFHQWLESDTFYAGNVDSLFGKFLAADREIRKRLSNFIYGPEPPPIYPMQWPEANVNTPPGMYLNHRDNAYGKDVFYINNFGDRFNVRTIDWIYMHEAIPGHHLQSCWRNSLKKDTLQSLFLYPGNFEGWACYVENFGKDLGLYRNLAAEIGKWEWDLVRSVRLVLDVGIHYYGWSRAEALDYWKKNIVGQDHIADREVSRVTNWPAQALSYKIGAKMLMQFRERLQNRYGNSFDPALFHKVFLDFGNLPLAVISDHIEEAYANAFNSRKNEKRHE